MALPPSDPDWNALVDEHGPFVLALCTRSDPDPDDAFQEAWARIHDRFHRFDPERGSLRTWIGTLVRRQLVDRYRRRRARGTPVALDALPLRSASDPHRDVASLLRRERLEDAIGRLPPDQRHVVLMHHLHGVSLAELADELDVPLGTVKSRLHRGRAALSRILRGSR